MDLLKNWVNTYNPKNHEDVFNAKREIVQEIALAGLARGGFFKKATFYGGTALRIFCGLDRFSEDLDFSLLTKNPQFTIQPFLHTLREEFSLLGLNVDTSIKVKKKHSTIESAFLKENSEWTFIEVGDGQADRIFPVIKIKIEIDRDPPLGFETETKLLLRPYSFYVNMVKEEYLFAGKMHAALFRQWGRNVKGRDWYDLQWFIGRGIKMNIDHFRIRAIESNSWDKNNPLNKEALLHLFEDKVKNLDISIARKDILRFVPDDSKIKIWSSEYFLDLIQHIKITSG